MNPFVYFQYDDTGRAFYDDVGAITLVLHCTTLDGKSHHNITSETLETAGSLQLSTLQNCPPDYYLVSFNQQVTV